MEPIFIVAEIGCNHNGDPSLAKKMVDEAKKCGVDAVKFQTFQAEALISSIAPKAEYQIANTGNRESQLEMTRKLELSQNDYLYLKNYAEKIGLNVFSTPFDLTSIEFLEKTKQYIWKIPSGEITNLPYLEKIRDINCLNKKIVLSTGMADIQEIREAINILDPTRNKIILLHCNTEYPTPDSDVNISAILDFRQNFQDLDIGYSDHSVGSVAAIMAVSYGISFIEKHFTLDKDYPGPDHKASATPQELKHLVQSVRRAEKMLGIGKKIVTQSEQKNSVVARKSIIAAKLIKKGDVFSLENITCKRPGNGISPMHWYELLGKKAKNDYQYDELIDKNELSF
ncbi:MAG: N-acetylneuraminate synthase [Acetobacter sp.]|nr:N-acetylneuraminate synthase [Acetobacter sp.]